LGAFASRRNENIQRKATKESLNQSMLGASNPVCPSKEGLIERLHLGSRQG
jgi:hypothetical protein